MSRLLCCLLFGALVLVRPATSHADTVAVAVASNFRPVLEQLAIAFYEDTGHQVSIRSGSTGKLYAQIVNGAPHDVFLAADAARPQRLERNGIAQPGSRFTYATGALALWSADKAYASRECRESLVQGDYRRLAIANPATAPFGAAARETLQRMGLWQAASPHLVVGENVAQALQFVASGNASLGLVARSQLRSGQLPATTCLWEVPVNLHSPIDQQAVVLQRAAQLAATGEFVAFLRSEASRRIIRRFGYVAGP